MDVANGLWGLLGSLTLALMYKYLILMVRTAGGMHVNMLSPLGVKFLTFLTFLT